MWCWRIQSFFSAAAIARRSKRRKLQDHSCLNPQEIHWRCQHRNRRNCPTPQQQPLLEVKDASCKIIRVWILRKFTDVVSIEIDEIAAIADLLTTNGMGLTFVWRVYLQRTAEVSFEYRLRPLAEYQLRKKAQVFCAMLTHQTVGKLLLGDTRGNVHVCDDYPWDLQASAEEDFKAQAVVKQPWSYYINVHGVDKVTSLGHMNNSKFDVISTAKQKHVKVLRYFEEEDKFKIVSTLKPGPLSWVLGVYSIGTTPVVVGGKGVMLYLWNLLDKQQLFSINWKGWNRHIAFALNPNNLANFFISFSNRNMLTVYYSNKVQKQVVNKWETLRASMHERETLTVISLYNKFANKLYLITGGEGTEMLISEALTVISLYNKFANKLYLITGGEGTEMLISEVKKDHLNLLKSLNYHTSSIRWIRKFLIEENDSSTKYYIASGGGQMLVNLFEIELTKTGFEIIHLTNWQNSKV